MRSTPLYRAVLYITVLLSITSYTIADNRPELLALALPVALAAWMLNRTERTPTAPRWAINLLVLVATAWTALEWLRVVRAAGPRGRGDAPDGLADTVGLFSVYLVLLLLIKLFDQRGVRDHAQLIALSVMLVIGSCLTSVTPALGLVLLLYLPLAMYTVMQYQLHAARARLGLAQARSGVEARPGPDLAGARLRAALRQLWLRLGIGVAVIATITFIVMPRGLGESMFGRMPQADAGFGERIAFTDTVQVGGSGIISESRRAVMEVRVRRRSPDRAGAPGADDGAGRWEPVESPVLLRGAVLDEWDEASGSWRRSEDVTQQRWAEEWEPDDRVAQRYGDVATHVVEVSLMRGAPASYFFTIWRPLAIDFEGAGEDVGYYRVRGDEVFKRNPSEPRSRTRRYTVYCREGGERPAEAFETELVGDEQFASGFVRDYAEQILAESYIDLEEDAGDPEIRRRIAYALRAHLAQEFEYALDVVAPLEGEDPLRRFFREKRGHCEYFASALASMCRSVGVRARVITGYYASEYNGAAEAFIVRENNAHAWVEAEVMPGVWEPLDASPSADVARLHRPRGGLLGLARRAIEMIEFAWIDKVIGYDRESQAATLGNSERNPISDFLESISPEGDGRGLRGPVQWVAVLERVLASLVVGAITFVAVAGLLALGRLPAGTLSRVVRWRAWPALVRVLRPGRSGRVASEAAYKRLLHQLDRAGLGKPEWRPPLAHVEALGEVDAELARASGEIVSRYYSARFGGAREEPGADPLLERVRERLRAVRRSGAARAVVSQSAG